MKRYFFLINMLLIPTLVGLGQEIVSTSKIGLNIISQVNQGSSYISFPTDIGNIQPLWFEGNIIPNFYLRQSQNSRLMGVLTAQIIIRMYQEDSFPIYTPSYIPQVTIYYSLDNYSKLKNSSLFWRFAHHSNGQEGNFFLDNGEINLKTGNFSTNFVEFGILKTHFNKRFNAHQFFKTSIEVHPESWSSDELKRKYSTVRWHNALSIFKLAANEYQNDKKKANISLKGESTWMFGSINNWHGISFDRLNLSLTFYYHPQFMEDIGLFVQYYHGMDYYNIYFNQKLDIIRFGLMTEKLRF